MLAFGAIASEEDAVLEIVPGKLARLKRSKDDSG
jgi:hypothetical protein